MSAAKTCARLRRLEQRAREHDVAAGTGSLTMWVSPHVGVPLQLLASPPSLDVGPSTLSDVDMLQRAGDIAEDSTLGRLRVPR